MWTDGLQSRNFSFFELPSVCRIPDFNVIHYKHTHGFSPVKTAPSRDALVNASPALVSSFVLCGKANRRMSKIMGRWRMGKQQGTLLLFSLSTALSLAVMTSAHAPNNTSYSFRRFRSIRPKGSSLASPRRTNSKEQLCHWMMLFIIKLEKQHEPKERWLRAVCACACVCVHLIAHPSGWFGEYEETHPPSTWFPSKRLSRRPPCADFVCVCMFV